MYSETAIKTLLKNKYNHRTAYKHPQTSENIVLQLLHDVFVLGYEHGSISTENEIMAKATSVISDIVCKRRL